MVTEWLLANRWPICFSSVLELEGVINDPTSSMYDCIWLQGQDFIRGILCISLMVGSIQTQGQH